ncbi:MAG: DUF2723 domain-containing protein [Caldilineaceae bacterium]|nr:DUF2723 domain-containing protein [Caldilineaceae bacterium]
MYSEHRYRAKIAQLSWDWLLPVVVGLGALLLYTVTAAPSLVALYDDSLEFQLVGPTFGIAHPTGYPLYTLLGGLWSRLFFPFGNWAWRMNIFSAVAGAATVALLFLLARRVAAGNPWAGLAAALTFALSPLWWGQTTVAEVYALHALFVAMILYMATADSRPQTADRRWNTQFTIPNTQHATLRQVQDNPRTTHYALRTTHILLLLGLGLAHHRTTALLLPGIALYLLWTTPWIWRPQRAWIGWAVALLAPLLLYAYIPLRAAMGAVDLEGAYINTWTGFWDHVLARGYAGFFAENPLAVYRSPGDWLALFVAQFGWIGVIFGVVGIVLGLLDRRLRPAWGLVLVTLIVNLLFAANYQVADAEVFTIPAFLCLALGIGKAVGSWQVAGSRWQLAVSAERERKRGRVGGVSQFAIRNSPYALLFLLLFFPLGRGPAVDRRADWAVHDYAVALAKVDFPAGSQVVGLRGQMTALAYMQRAEGLGMDARPVTIDDPAARRAYVEASVEAGIPLFLTQELAGIEERYSFSGEGPLIRVWPRNAASAPSPQVTQIEFLADDALQLLGYDLDRLAQAGGPGLRVAFYWQPMQSLDRVLKLSLRLLDADGQVLAQEDRFPLHQVALTTHWSPGDTVRDVHYLPLPAGADQLLVVVYDADSVEEVGRFQIDLPPLYLQ